VNAQYPFTISLLSQVALSQWEKGLQAISKMEITFKDKARADEKAQHTRE
jgi:hypothetical protein